MDIIVKAMELITRNRSEEQLKGFLEYHIQKLWSEYERHLMDSKLLVQNRLNEVPLNLPNASVKQPYEQIITIEDKMLIELSLDFQEPIPGLECIKLKNGRQFKIAGTPSQSGTFNVILSAKGLSTRFDSPVSRIVPLIINPDPWDLWKDVPVPEDIEYPKADTDTAFLKVPPLDDGTLQKTAVAASRRGRSHAQEGKPRDDDFKVCYDEQSRWYVLTVADGAGSAPFAREGSKIACNSASSTCLEALKAHPKLETDIFAYLSAPQESGVEALLRKDLYEILAGAAFKAYKAVEEEAMLKGRKSRDYSTTLLLSACKRFEFGWFVASFGVGDGAIALYCHEDQRSKLMCKPDEGEYAGQTKFLSPEIFKDYSSVAQRIGLVWVKDFTALFMMTDGVSDPKFGSDADLHKPEKWAKLWQELNDPSGPVNLSAGNEEVSEGLLQWLNFRSMGNHDDRTLAVLY